MFRSLNCSITLIALLSCVPGSALAQPGKVYVGGKLGIAVPAENSADRSGTAQLVEDGSVILANEIDETSDLVDGVGAAGGIFAGYRILDNFAVEIESSARAFSLEAEQDDTGTVGLLSANLVYWGDTKGPLTPYAGFGLGVARLDGPNEVFDSVDNQMGYRVKAGILRAFGRSHGIGLEVGYQGSTAFESGSTETIPTSSGEIVNDINSEYKLSSFDVGVVYRYSFGG